MKNKWFVSLLLIVAMLCTCWTDALADEERKTFTSGYYEYTLLNDGTVEITKYNGSTKRLTIADTLDGKKVTSIGDDAFSCSFSLTSVSIPDSVTSIGKYAFSGCWSLTSVSIPDSVTSIGKDAFFNCSSLSSIFIPDSVAQINANPFPLCDSLESISVSLEQPYFAVIDGVLFRKADKTLVSYPIGIASSTYSIPNGITCIAEGAFCGSSLSSVFIPDSVSFIGNAAFSICTSLASVSIPNSVTSIGDNTFSSCYSLSSIFIPNSVTSIGSCAFGGCSSLTSISIPDSVTCIASGAFDRCSSLPSVFIPNSVVQIDGNPFSSCNALKSISISPDHPHFSAIDGILFRKADNALIAYPAGIDSSTYNIPQGVTSM